MDVGHVPFVPLHRPEVIPGRLSVVVTECAAGPPGVRVWVYATQGMESAGQREIVLALVRAPHQEPARFPDFPLGLFRQIYELAASGSTVEAGGCTTVSAYGPGIGDGGPIGGLVYVRCPLPGRPVPGLELNTYGRAPLLAIPLTPRELDGATRFGHARVLSLLGERARVYPHPWWFDGRLDSVIDPGVQDDASILARTARAHAWFTEVTRSGSTLDVRVVEDDRPRLAELLRQAPDSFALYTGTSPTARLTAVWRPDTGRGAIYPGGGDRVPSYETEAVGGNFLLLAHGDVPAMAAELEDGFALTLPTAEFHRLVAAVAAGSPYSCRLTEGAIGLVRVETTPTRQFTLDGGTAYAEDGFRTHTPGPDAAAPHFLRNLNVRHIVLLTGEAEIGMAVSVDALSAFIREVEGAADAMVHNTGVDELMVEVALAPGGPVRPLVSVREHDKRGQGLAPLLARQLERMPPPPVRHHEVRFQIVFGPPATG